MRCVPFLVTCGLALLAATPLYAASDEIAAEPNPATPGQAVTLRWYFTGSKVVVSGGRFGKGAVVTGRTALTDHPRTTTRYTFDVWYRGQAPVTATGQTAVKPLHARYSVVVEVSPPPSFVAYQNPRGWQIRYLKGWKCDSVPMADPENNGLFYFQQEDDSVERLAVSILPAGEMDADALMKKVQADLPSHYDQVEVLGQNQIIFAEAPALWTAFIGVDQTHPGTRTQSLILAFIRDGRAYVVSARTAAERFKTRQAVLEQMVKSFTLTKKTSRASR